MAGSGAVDDLLAEVVAFGELFANDLNDVVGVVIVFGEDEGLRDLWVRLGEDFGEQLVSEGTDDGADLVQAATTSPIERAGGGVGEVLIEKFGAACACEAVALIDVETGFDASEP